MKLQIALVLFGFCSIASAVDLKGIPLGSPRGAVEAKMPTQKCGEELVSYQSCFVTGETYANKVPVQFEVIYVAGTFEGYGVRLEGRFFDDIKTNIEERIGPHDTLESWQKPDPMRVIVGTVTQIVHWTKPELQASLMYFPATDGPPQRPAQTRISVSSKKANDVVMAYAAAKKARAAEKAKADM